MVFKGVRSPRRGHTITQLRELSKSDFYNADTRTELSPEESKLKLLKMEQKRADKITGGAIRRLSGMKTRSRGRPWIPPGQVIFRRINGRIVPFRKAAEDPFL
jgi:hypothetical protein